MAAMAGDAYIRSGAVGPAFVPKYRVVSPLVLVKTADGKITHAYEGCLLEDLMPEQMWFLDGGLVELVDPVAVEPAAVKK